MTETPPAVLYCANHPDRETNLRCNRCEKPICTQCAVLTPTGYRCKECVRGQQKVFETTQTADYLITFIIVVILSFLGSLVATFLGFFVIFIAPVAGVVIAEAVRAAIRRRRSQRLFQLAIIAAVLGGLPSLLGPLLPLLLGGFGGSLGALLPLLYRGLYIFLVTSTVYYRLSGIQL
jgi:hypothetical protein